MEKSIDRIGRELSERKNRTCPAMGWLTGKLYPKLLRLPEKRKRYHNPFIKAADLSTDKQIIIPRPS